MTNLILRKHNEVFTDIITDESIARELSDYFSFLVDNYQYMPAFKSRRWDGKVRCFDLRTRRLYTGLYNRLLEFCRINQYSIGYENAEDYAADAVSVEELTHYIASLNLPETLQVREYQIASFLRAVRNRRRLIVLPTGSGKSLVIYLLTRYYNKKTIVVVPTIALVEQMYDDFAQYGLDVEKYCHRIYTGQEKFVDKQIVFTTWQSASMMPQDWKDQFEVVVGDEAHLFSANSLKDLMVSLTNCYVRIGLTGTLDYTKTSQMMLEGLFGKPYAPTSTSELVDQGFLAKPLIKALVLIHPKVKFADYATEMQYLSKSDKRNHFIANLALSLKGNSIILFSSIEQGKNILAIVEQRKKKKQHVFYIDGTVEGSERNDIKKFANQNENVIVVASYKTFGIGTNIPNLENIILGSPTKSMIRLLQAIGRGLRKINQKVMCTIFDIADDLSSDRPNFTLNHFNERVHIYNQQNFDYKMYNINL